MQQFIQFIVQNWIISTAIVAVVVLLIVEETRGSVRGIQKLSPQQVVKQMNHEHALVIDCRSEEAYQGGHILGAKNMPKEALEDSMKQLARHKKGPLIVVSDNEQAAASVGVLLRKQGFDGVACLAGGISAWKDAKLPLTKQ